MSHSGERALAQAWFSIHHDGSVTLACIIGKIPVTSGSFLKNWHASSTAIEIAVADRMGVL